MHGRLKVRTSEEQAERKRLEREKKLKIYQNAMSKCFDLIKSETYTLDGIKLSEQILMNNVDIQTLWNFRRNILESLKNTSNEENVIEYYKNEMSLTENCLKQNAKSYPCWHHRRWCLIKSNQDNYGTKSEVLSWTHELKLCNQFLSLDERNFHCWKHRLFVVDNGKLSKSDELNFMYEKIGSNFSNYSAWHYRSKLIEDLYYKNQIDSNIFKNELNLIENALFTDPNDQSAWIYEKWLLLEYQRSHIKELTFNALNSNLEFKFAKKIDLNHSLTILKLNGVEVLNGEEKLTWNNENNNEVWSANIPISSIMIKPEETMINLEISSKNLGISIEVVLEKKETNDLSLFSFKSKFDMNNIKLDSEMIKSHLDNILELSKLESDKNKWCLLTSLELMILLDLDKYREVILDNLDKLANEIDVYRKNFYFNLKNKIQKKF